MLDFGQSAPLKFADAVSVVRRCIAEARFPEKVSVSEAARRHRVLDNPGGYSGRWGEGPFFAGHVERPMDCLASHSPYREVGVMGPSQMAKSEIGNNWQLHSVIYDPADMLFIAPDRVLIESYVKKEFDKMVELARDGDRAILRERMLPGSSSDTMTIKRFRGADLFFFWPTGGRLRALPFSRVRLDDLDEIPTDISDQGGAIGLARGRMASFSAYGRTMLYVNSSPKLGARRGIEAFVAGGTDERFYVDCLMCGTPFALDTDRLTYEAEGSPADAAASAAVLCPAPDCGGVHLQHEKRALLDTYRWVGTGETAVSRRESRDGKEGELTPNIRASFRFDGLFGFRPWREIAHLRRAAELAFDREQDEGELKTFYQTVAGKNYTARASGEDVCSESELAERALISPYVMGEVPPGVEVLIAAIDQQANRFEVAVWGFGQDFRAWLIDRYPILTCNRDGRQEPIRPFTRAEDWQVIHDYVLQQDYTLAGAPHLRMKVFNTAVDTGGLDAATDNAFTWWHAMVMGDAASGRRPLPASALTLIKGGNNPRAKRLPPPTIDAKRQIKGAPQAELYVPNVSRLKDIANTRLNRRDDGPGYIQFPRDIPGVRPGDNPNYLAELRAEVKQGEQWVRDSHVANETWDLYIYAFTVMLRFGGGDGSLGWVPDWARPPRGGPAKLDAALPDSAPVAALAGGSQQVIELKKRTGLQASKKRRNRRLRTRRAG